MSACLSESTVVAFVEGTLAAALAPGVYRHIAVCSHCHAAVAWMRKLAPSFAAHSAQRSADPDAVCQPIAAEPPVENAGIAEVAGFTVHRRLGAGAFGQVFEATPQGGGHKVALKLIHPRYAADAELRGRLFQELRAVRLIKHPGVVEIHDCGELPDGAAYLTMELLPGQTLREHLRRPGTDERAAALTLYLQVAETLVAVHQQGVVHRDLKPDNIMVVASETAPRQERTKILDFGLAKLTEEPAGAENSQVSAATAPRTQTGTRLGTPSYMAPEQCRGDRVITTKADVYALGAMLFEHWAGRPPFVAATGGELCAMHQLAAPPRLRQLAPTAPRKVERLVMAMLAKAPQDRPAMKEVVKLLAALQPGAPAEPARPGHGALGLWFGHGAPWGPWEQRGHLTRSERAGRLGRAALLLAALVVLIMTCGADPEEVYVPGGTFRMGSSLEEAQSGLAYCQRLGGKECKWAYFVRELPAHEVTVSPFFMDRTEVTNAAFARWIERKPGLRVERPWVREADGALVGLDPDIGISGLLWEGGHFFPARGLEQHAVVQVTFRGAERYCRDHGGRLPTEAEFEFVARGPTRATFPWGDVEPTCAGVTFGRQPGARCQHLGSTPSRVGRSAQDRSREGIFDLGGNVSEWTRDFQEVPYAACAGPCQDPQVLAPRPGSFRTVRGGNFWLSSEACRAAGRVRVPDGQARGNVGFRCVYPAP